MRKNFKMKLNFEDYRDRVYACWLGKNIGGTMGAPYEGQRSTCDIKSFATEAGVPTPNDDLDLQLIWLHAVESMGPLAINAATLGEFWISLIPPNWNEYGIGKNNMRRGLVPPLSGDYQNVWKHSNGAWIRTEVWACLAPGYPQLAAKYAIEDAKVDHGAGEGTVAAAFVAALQSSAFVIHDLHKCIDLALSAIPENSRMADSIRFILDCYEKGMEPMDARNAIQQRNADIGNGWFEAPSNVAYALIGLLWGEGDFKKSMITAINCGDDTDCTGATVGATLGILGGSSIVPNDWKAHIGDQIVTISVNRGDGKTGGAVPKTCTELTDRVVIQAPYVLFANGAYASLTQGSADIPEDTEEFLQAQCEKFAVENPLKPYSARYESAVLSAVLFLDSAPDIEPLEEKTLTVEVRLNRALGDELCNLNCRWWLPDGFAVKSGKQTAVITNKTPHSPDFATLQFTLTAGETVSPANRCVLEIDPVGRCTPLYIPITFLG